MDISLTPELEEFVNQEVNSGLYKTASEVVRAGLRRLKEERDSRLLPTPAMRAELEAQLLAAVDSLDAQRGGNGEAAIRRFCKRIKEGRD